MTENVIDTFMSAANTRRIELIRRTHTHKPWLIRVSVSERVCGERRSARLITLSESEYADEEVARRDFEMRRPNFRVQEQEMYGRGKRLVQEVMEEKLGGKD